MNILFGISADEADLTSNILIYNVLFLYVGSRLRGLQIDC